MSKRALITGISGQDGAYLARLLLDKGYQVCGLARDLTPTRLWRLHKLGITQQLLLEANDLSRDQSIAEVVRRFAPDEVYNLAGASHVSASFEHPVEAAEANGLLVARLLEVLRQTSPSVRYFQACSSEMYGRRAELPQREATAFHPVSPYGAAKLFAHWITVTYRDAYGMHASCGILFNHESPLRAPSFVTRKIVRGLIDVAQGRLACLELGNLDSKRDWGYAPCYVEGMWRMLQQPQGDDFVLATGQSFSVRDLVSLAAQHLGMALVWSGRGPATIAMDQATGRQVIKVNPAFYRPLDIDEVRGDPTKAERLLGWKARVSLPDLIKIMLEDELAAA